MLHLFGNERAHDVGVVVRENRNARLHVDNVVFVVIILFLIILFIVFLVFLVLIFILALVLIVVFNLNVLIILQVNGVAGVVHAKHRALLALEVFWLRVAHVRDLQIANRVQVVDFTGEQAQRKEFHRGRHGVLLVCAWAVQARLFFQGTCKEGGRTYRVGTVEVLRAARLFFDRQDAHGGGGRSGLSGWMCLSALEDVRRDGREGDVCVRSRIAPALALNSAIHSIEQALCACGRFGGVVPDARILHHVLQQEILQHGMRE